MKTLQRSHLWLGVLIALALQACATTSGEDLSDRLYKADRALTESMLLATDLRTQGLVNDEDWPQVKEQLNQARSEMTEAWASYDTDPEYAARSLGSVEGILVTLTKRVPELQKSSRHRPPPRATDTPPLRSHIKRPPAGISDTPPR